MSVGALPAPARLDLLGGELRKLPAFVRRDFLVAWSYRMVFVSDWLGLLAQAVFLYFIGRLVDPRLLPSFGGARSTYLEFVAVGIAIGVFVQLGLQQVSAGVRQEQLLGTLEALLTTPTALATIQAGAVAYQLIYIPIRTGLFLFLIAVGFGLQFRPDGIAPATLVLLLFVPFVWGLGLAAGAATLTFRRGTGGVSFLAALLTVGSGAYFPLSLLPGRLAAAAGRNPVAVAVDGMRGSLIGGADWSRVAGDAAVLAPAAAVALLVGVAAFRRALARERRRGSLGLY